MSLYPSKGAILFLPVNVVGTEPIVYGSVSNGTSKPLIAIFCVRSKTGDASSILFLRLTETPEDNLGSAGNVFTSTE